MFFWRKRFFLKSRAKRAKPLVIMALILLFAVLMVRYPDSLQKLYSLAPDSVEDYSAIICEGLPGDISSGGSRYTTDYLLQRLVFWVTGIDTGNPAGIIAQELNLSGYQAAASFHLATAVEEEGGEEDFYLPGQDGELDDWISIPEGEIPPVELNGEPMVLIYTTHNAESYKPSDGVSRLEGKNGGIADIAKLLAHSIENHAIKTIYSDVIHDYPDYTKSYINSMRTVQQLIKENPKLQLVLDIHRDAGMDSRSDTLVTIKGKPCAKVMIVVGTEHPRWQDNLAFAEKIETKANELYPGLIKCIRVRKDRRYNQHLHPRALLLEVGSDLNTREDAINSTVLMAEVIAEVLKEK